MFELDENRVRENIDDLFPMHSTHSTQGASFLVKFARSAEAVCSHTSFFSTISRAGTIESAVSSTVMEWVMSKKRTTFDENATTSDKNHHDDG
jgi:hypothetical protein